MLSRLHRKAEALDSACLRALGHPHDHAVRQELLSALEWARHDREVANVWLETSLEALTLSKNESNTAARQRATLRRSFKPLDPRSERWVDPGLAMRWREFWAA